MWIRALLLTSSVLAVSCRNEPKRLDPVPKELEAKVTLAQGAIGELKKTLSGKLQAAMQTGGPAAGIDACSSEAAELTKSVGAGKGVEIGRSSHKLRNQANAPRAWVQGYLTEIAGKPAKDVKPGVFDLGDELGVAEPLATQPLCLTCHGQNVPADVKAKIGERYPNDQANGFAEGDVRGVVWVEIPKK